jgi:membrane fusion protein, heavy metal efflux system
MPQTGWHKLLLPLIHLLHNNTLTAMKYIIVFLFGCTLIACGDGSNKTEIKTETVEANAVDENTVQLTDEQARNAGVEIGKLEYKNISSTLKVSGIVDVPPQNIVAISVPLGGYLKTTRLLQGMYVSKGQNIATMEDPQYIQLQQDYLTAKAKQAYAQQEYNRQKELNESKASSDKMLQQTQAELSTQTIMVSSLGEKLRLININPSRITAGSITRSIPVYSPISGYVSKVNVNIGKYVNPADVLFEIINPANIHLSLNVFERDVARLHMGQRVLAYTNTNPTKKYVCKISLIGKDFSEDRTVNVHVHFETYDKELIPGTFMNADIEAQNQDVYALPADAIVRFENNQYVFVEKSKNVFEMTKVETGSTQNDFTEISDVSVKSLTDKKIAVKGAYSLLMKLKNTTDEE